MEKSAKEENKTQLSFSQIQSSNLHYREGWKTLKGDDTTRTITTTIISIIIYITDVNPSSGISESARGAGYIPGLLLPN